MKKSLALLLAGVLACTLFFGCSKKANDSVTEMGNAMEAPKGDAEDMLTDSTSQTFAPQTQQKLVRKIYLEAETENMDPLLDEVAKRLTELEGYVESRNVYNGSQYSGRRYRSAELTLRIPAEKLDQFVSQLSEKSNIISNRETTEDITLTYVAAESRLTALKTEQTRLLELLAEAKDMADLLKIEERLTQVQYELEQTESQLRVFDNKVNYGTVYLTVSEVKEYTVVEEPETVWERIAVGFKDSLKALGKFFTELFVGIVVGVPYFIVIGALAVPMVLLIKRYRKKKKAQKEEPEAK